MALEQLEDKFDALCKESKKLNADFNGIISEFRTYSQRTGLFCGGISGYMQQFGHAVSKKFSQIILPMFGVFFLCSLVPVWTTYTVLQPIVRAAERLHERFCTLKEEAKKLVSVEGGDAEVARNTTIAGQENVEVARDIERGNVEGEGDTERGNVEGEGDTERGNVEGEGDTERGNVEGEGDTERGIVEGEGDIERGNVDGEGDIERGNVEGEGDIERGNVEGEGDTERGNVEGEGDIERGIVEGGGDIERGNVEGEGDIKRGNVGRGIDRETGNVDVVAPPLQNLSGANVGGGIKAAAGNVVATSQNGRRLTAEEKGGLLEKIEKELEQLKTWKQRHLKFLLLEILNGFLLDVLLVTTITGVYHLSVEHNKRP